jgi:hypothetical protein
LQTWTSRDDIGVAWRKRRDVYLSTQELKCRLCYYDKEMPEWEKSQLIG